jgi:hypothetical protein
MQGDFLLNGNLVFLANAESALISCDLFSSSLHPK